MSVFDIYLAPPLNWYNAYSSNLNIEDFSMGVYFGGELLKI